MSDAQLVLIYQRGPSQPFLTLKEFEHYLSKRPLFIVPGECTENGATE